MSRSGARRSAAGLVIALLSAVVVWWTQADQTPADQTQADQTQAPDSSTMEPTSPSPRAQSPSAQSPAPSGLPSSSPRRTQVDPSAQGNIDPASGLPIVSLDRLPPEAADTLDLIDAGGPFPEDEDGSTFQNREGILPGEQLGYYAEFTVPTPGSPTRGARRIVAGDGGELYWTADHYQSFAVIERDGGAR